MVAGRRGDAVLAAALHNREPFNWPDKRQPNGLAGDLAFSPPPSSHRSATVAGRGDELAGTLRRELHVGFRVIRQWLLAGFGRHAERACYFDYVLLISAVLPAVVLYFWPLTEDVQVGAFFGAASWTLAALLWLAYRRLKSGATGRAVVAGSGNLLRLALRNAARNPGRSSLSIALVASAAFLIVAVSVFHIEPEGEILGQRGGSGGFTLVCQSDQPIYVDLGSPQGRSSLDLPAEDEALLAKTSIFGFRVKPGDDASCLNLYSPRQGNLIRQPRVLGVPKSFCDQCGTRFSDAAGGVDNVFQTLRPQNVGDAIAKPASGDCQVILDRATANYSLDLWQGIGERFTIVDGRGQKLDLQVAALLDNSIFQGDLLISEEDLLQYDPLITGYRFFLVECPSQSTAAVRQMLEPRPGRLRFCGPTVVRTIGWLPLGTKHISFDLPKLGRPRVTARHVRARGGATS